VVTSQHTEEKVPIGVGMRAMAERGDYESPLEENSIKSAEIHCLPPFPSKAG
jgi:hypothetical protein